MGVRYGCSYVATEN